MLFRKDPNINNIYSFFKKKNFYTSNFFLKKMKKNVSNKYISVNVLSSDKQTMYLCLKRETFSFEKKIFENCSTRYKHYISKININFFFDSASITQIITHAININCFEKIYIQKNFDKTNSLISAPIQPELNLLYVEEINRLSDTGFTRDITDLYHINNIYDIYHSKLKYIYIFTHMYDDVSTYTTYTTDDMSVKQIHGITLNTLFKKTDKIKFKRNPKYISLFFKKKKPRYYLPDHLINPIPILPPGKTWNDLEYELLEKEIKKERLELKRLKERTNPRNLVSDEGKVRLEKFNKKSNS